MDSTEWLPLPFGVATTSNAEHQPMLTMLVQTAINKYDDKKGVSKGRV